MSFPRKCVWGGGGRLGFFGVMRIGSPERGLSLNRGIPKKVARVSLWLPQKKQKKETLKLGKTRPPFLETDSAHSLGSVFVTWPMRNAPKRHLRSLPYFVSKVQNSFGDLQQSAFCKPESRALSLVDGFPENRASRSPGALCFVGHPNWAKSSSQTPRIRTPESHGSCLLSAFPLNSSPFEFTRPESPVTPPTRSPNHTTPHPPNPTTHPGSHQPTHTHTHTPKPAKKGQPACGDHKPGSGSDDWHLQGFTWIFKLMLTPDSHFLSGSVNKSLNLLFATKMAFSKSGVKVRELRK